MTTTTRPTRHLTIDDAQRQEALALLARLEEHDSSVSNAVLPISKGLEKVLRTALDTIGHGGRVTLTPLPEQLTTTMAADLLGVSRPTLMKLIADGELKATLKGTHHRVALSEVRALKRRRLAEQRAAFAELTALSDELDLP